MVRKPMMLLALGLVLGAPVVYAQEAEAKPVRFEALVKVGELAVAGEGAGVMVLKPGAEAAVPVVPYKAYPYGTVFTVTEGTKVRVNFEPFTYVAVRGPAKFCPKSNDDWSAVTVAVDYGECNVAVDDRVLPGQFQVVTPLGTFASLVGRSRLRMDQVAPGAELSDENFSFRLLSGTASFQGKHFSAPELTQTNAFIGAETSDALTEVTGRVGEVKLDLPSGAGKTTTLKGIVGILQFDSGEITIDGVSIKDDPIACKKKLAYIPDNPDLYEFMTGLQYLFFISDIFGVGEKERKERIEKYAEAFAIKDDLNSPISSYSHGMKQKLAVISALVHDPKLIIMDEPFVGLDPIASHLLKEIMREKCNNGGAIFFSTHVLEVAEKLCDKIAIIKGGKLIKSGTMEEVKGDSSLESVFLELEG